jgi:hypothetical protein
MQRVIRKSGRLIVVGTTNARVDLTTLSLRPLLSIMLVTANVKQTNRRYYYGGYTYKNNTTR